MTQTYDLIVRGGEVANHAGRGRADVGVIDGKIAFIGDLGQALAGLHRPGSATLGVVLSLGLGLTAVTGVSLVDGNLQEMIYLGATFLLATNALPRNIAIALRLLQQGLELGNEDARFFKNMSQRLIDEHLEAEDAATGQLA